MPDNEIDLTPDCAGMYRHFIAEAERRGLSLTGDLSRCQTPAETLDCMQAFLFPAIMALETATHLTVMERVRTLMADALASVNAAVLAAKKEGPC